MASRGFFGYDPYDDDDSYYYASPYTIPYYHHLYNQPAPARRAGGGFFPAAADHYQPASAFPATVDADAYYQRTPARRAGGLFPATDHFGYQRDPASARRTGGFFPATADVDSYHQQPTLARRAGGVFPAARNAHPAAAMRPKSGPLSRSAASIPVHFVGSEPEPEEDARVPVKRALSAEEAAVRLQAAARGLLARRAVRALRAVEREAGEVAEKVAREAEALRRDARARVAVGEALMRLLLRLDAVRGARGYRRRVARRVLALQDAVDALEQRPPEEGEAETTAAVATADDEEEENAVVPEGGVEMYNMAEGNAASEMEVDGGRDAGEPSAAGDPQQAPDVANRNDGGDKPADDEDAECEWEMVSEEPAAAGPATAPHAPPQPQDQADGAGSGVDAKKLMEMVAALCEQTAQQCAVIGALAERVDSLERALRRVEDAERRRRAKKLRMQGKGSDHQIKCYTSD